MNVSFVFEMHRLITRLITCAIALFVVAVFVAGKA